MNNGTGLRYLFADWANGATIDAGTGRLSKVPAHPRTAKKCASCETWAIGAGEAEAAHRLAEHRRRAHG